MHRAGAAAALLCAAATAASPPVLLARVQNGKLKLKADAASVDCAVVTAVIEMGTRKQQFASAVAGHVLGAAASLAPPQAEHGVYLSIDAGDRGCKRAVVSAHLAGQGTAEELQYFHFVSRVSHHVFWAIHSSLVDAVIPAPLALYTRAAWLAAVGGGPARLPTTTAVALAGLGRSERTVTALREAIGQEAVLFEELAIEKVERGGLDSLPGAGNKDLARIFSTFDYHTENTLDGGETWNGTQLSMVLRRAAESAGKAAGIAGDRQRMFGESAAAALLQYHDAVLSLAISRGCALIGHVMHCQRAKAVAGEDADPLSMAVATTQRDRPVDPHSLRAIHTAVVKSVERTLRVVMPKADDETILKIAAGVKARMDTAFAPKTKANDATVKKWLEGVAKEFTAAVSVAVVERIKMPMSEHDLAKNRKELRSQLEARLDKLLGSEAFVDLSVDARKIIEAKLDGEVGALKQRSDEEMRVFFDTARAAAQQRMDDALRRLRIPMKKAEITAKLAEIKKDMIESREAKIVREYFHGGNVWPEWQVYLDNETAALLSQFDQEASLYEKENRKAGKDVARDAMLAAAASFGEAAARLPATKDGSFVSAAGELAVKAAAKFDDEVAPVDAGPSRKRLYEEMQSQLCDGKDSVAAANARKLLEDQTFRTALRKAAEELERSGDVTALDKATSGMDESVRNYVMMEGCRQEVLPEAANCAVWAHVEVSVWVTLLDRAGLCGVFHSYCVKAAENKHAPPAASASNSLAPCPNPLPPCSTFWRRQLPAAEIVLVAGWIVAAGVFVAGVYSFCCGAKGAAPAAADESRAQEDRYPDVSSPRECRSGESSPISTTSAHKKKQRKDRRDQKILGR
eukprot:TRINITY_DN5620_c0_g1_i1.p1 TRINITY_DN5620_c0_g1~~TRINITY_DN5620_c0_g1_i1.p1  ORF type:complete len:859 (+),score=257.04 TRINITY_DN5620_c0_g1_i1:92-2668(+)